MITKRGNLEILRENVHTISSVISPSEFETNITSIFKSFLIQINKLFISNPKLLHKIH